MQNRSDRPLSERLQFGFRGVWVRSACLALGLPLIACSSNESKATPADKSVVELELPNAAFHPVPELRDVPLDSAVSANMSASRPANPASPSKEEQANTSRPSRPVRRQSEGEYEEFDEGPAPTPEPRESARPAPVIERKPAPSIVAGTSISTVAQKKFCSNTLNTGEEIQAQTGADITGRDGAMIPAGATVTFSVLAVSDKELRLVPVAVRIGGERYSIDGAAKVSEWTAVSAPKAGRAKKGGLFGGLAAAGAAVLAGKDAKTAIGAGAAGAAAGAAIGAATAGSISCTGDPARIDAQLGAALILNTR